MIQPSTIKESPPAIPAADVARVAGRGAIYITIAKLWFMASGYGIHFTLPRLMTKEMFGVYSFVISAVSVVNAVIVTGTYQTVSKYISNNEEKSGAIRSKALRLQILVGGALALGFFLAAPLVAAQVSDPGVITPLRVASLITLAYAFYSVYTGYFNGRREFLKQAVLDMAYSTLKLVFIVLFVWVGFGVVGGVAGFALAAASVLAISAIAAGRGKGAGEVRAAELLRFQVYLLAFTLVLNLLQKVDTFLIKALSSPDPDAASANVGLYSPAINVANITYQVIISVTFVIFPLISQSTFVDDRPRTRGYITSTIKYTLMVMALLATVFSANASEVLRVIYPEEYQAGSGALAVVAYGMLFFGLLHVMTTMITASGRPLVSLVIGAITLVASAALNAALIPAHGIVGAAIGTSAAMLLGVLSSGGYLIAKFGGLIEPLSLIRIGASAALIYFASLAMRPTSKALILAQLAGLCVLYFVMLVASRELGRADLEAIKKVVRKR